MLAVLRDGAALARDGAPPDASVPRLAHAVMNVPAGGVRYALRIGASTSMRMNVLPPAAYPRVQVGNWADVKVQSTLVNPTANFFNVAHANAREPNASVIQNGAFITWP